MCGLQTTHLPSVDKYEENKNKRMEEIKRLKRLLEGQQRSLRAARQSYAAELYGRTELQRFLKQCLIDVREQITQKEQGSQLASVLSGKTMGMLVRDPLSHSCHLIQPNPAVIP